MTSPCRQATPRASTVCAGQGAKLSDVYISARCVQFVCCRSSIPIHFLLCLVSALRSRHITDRPPYSWISPIDLPLLDQPARRQGVRPQVIIKSEGRRIHLHRCETHLPRPVQGLLPVHDDGAVLEKDSDEDVIQAARASGCVCVRHDGYIGRRNLIAQRSLETAWGLRVRYTETGLTPVCESKASVWSMQQYVPFVHVPFTNMYSSNWWLTS